jgi:hypothetical protein
MSGWRGKKPEKAYLLKYTDPDGNSPNKAQAATINVFIIVMNTSPSKVGLTKGVVAERVLQSFSDTNGIIPKPTKTPYFNNQKGE